MVTAQVSKSSGRSMRQTLHQPDTKVTLPTGETVSKYLQLRRVQIPGFPAINEPLPEGIQTEDIIKQWPNHLWGPLLLQIVAHWSPKQINILSGGRFKPNSIVKRVKAARLQAGEILGQVKPPKKGGTNPRKRKRDQICEDGLNAEQLEVESEASRQLRISQMEIEEAVKMEDPNYELRQIGLAKKIPGLDRILIEQAFEERKEKMKSM
ncbi:MAG: hypothetical protein Q9161_009327 [Pseudevernia consocians]